jgi:hypothetical protein
MFTTDYRAHVVHDWYIRSAADCQFRFAGCQSGLLLVIQGAWGNAPVNSEETGALPQAPRANLSGTGGFTGCNDCPARLPQLYRLCRRQRRNRIR